VQHVREGYVNESNLEIETYPATAATNVIRVVGDFCGEGAVRVRRTLAGELTGSPAVLVLDLSEVARIDAQGVDALHLAAELAANEDIGLCLVAPAQGAAKAALDAVESTDTFEIFSSLSEALSDSP
jgi:anti-anti-sigma regulatory factor